MLLGENLLQLFNSNSGCSTGSVRRRTDFIPVLHLFTKASVADPGCFIPDPEPAKQFVKFVNLYGTGTHSGPANKIGSRKRADSTGSGSLRMLTRKLQKQTCRHPGLGWPGPGWPAVHSRCWSQQTARSAPDPWHSGRYSGWDGSLTRLF
jgi:hypothetical protein